MSRAVEQWKEVVPRLTDRQLFEEKMSDEVLVSKAGFHCPSALTGASPSPSQQALNTEDLEDKLWSLCSWGNKVVE